MKRYFALFTAALLCFIYMLPCLAAGLTYAPTPIADTTLLFTRKLGSGYKNAPTPIAAGNGCVYVAAGKTMYKLDAETGETLASVIMENVSTYTAVAPLVTEQTVYMPLDDGIVQAFAASDLSPMWIYTDPLGGQGLCPVVYYDGYVYTGFWNGETDDANFVCLSANGNGEQNAVWRFSSTGGFYRTGALITGDYVIVGSDNGRRTDQPEASSHIYSLRKSTGELVSQLTTTGDIRAGIGYDRETGACYTASKSGDVYRFMIDQTDGTLHSLTSARLSGGSTVTPIPYRGRLYAGSGDGRKGRFYVMDAISLRTIYFSELPGSPQGDMLLSAAYEEEDGELLIYATYNAPPGGIYVFKDAPGQTEAAAVELFAPPEGMRQYCFCPVAADAYGRLFYKNDSGTIFALSGDAQATRNMLLLLRILQFFRFFITFFGKLSVL